MTWSHRLAVPLVAILASCGGRPAGEDPVQNSIRGTVYMSGPVAGAVVTAYDLDPDTGDIGDALARSEPTDSDGMFQLTLGPTAGEILLEARGPEATWTEDASGSAARFEDPTRIRVIPATRDPQTGIVELGLEVGIDSHVALTPVSELAVSYGLAKARNGGSADEHLQRSFEAFRAHVEYDFWRVFPRPMSSGPHGAFDERAQAGLVLAGLSHYGRRIANASDAGSGTVSSLAVMEALKTDLTAGPIFDGEGPGGLAIILGACPEEATFCKLTPRSARGDWAESIALFLAEPVNESGFSYPDLRDFIQRMSQRSSVLFQGPGSDPDSTPPRVTVEGVLFRDVVDAPRVLTVTISDAFELDPRQEPTIRLRRGGEFLSRGVTARLVTETASSRIYEVDLDARALPDGPIELVVTAVDARANGGDIMTIGFVTDHAPEGGITGTVTAAGPVDGAQVLVFDATGGKQGDLITRTITEEDGTYSVTIPESPETTALRIVATAPRERSEGAAAYVDPVTGEGLVLSANEELELLIEDYVDGAQRVAHVTPLTDIGAAFARGLWEFNGGQPETWAASVKQAYEILEDHFDDGTRIDLRRVPPADPTSEQEMSTLNAQARYGLLIAGLGELAHFHAVESNATTGAMNLMTLTELLAKDLLGDLDDSGRTTRPLFTGTHLKQSLTHGEVKATSFWTRDDLAHGIADWVEKNSRDGSSFSLRDLESFIDQISLDADPRLYPLADKPRAFDRVEPTLEWVDVPASPAILRGQVTLRVRARDNRKLLRDPSPRAGLDWTAPDIDQLRLRGLGDLTGTDQFAGPWELSVNVDLEKLPEGPVTFSARATDEATRQKSIETTIVVDRTPPTVAVVSATAGENSLKPGEVTGADTLVVKARALDDRQLRSAAFRWNGSEWSPAGELAPDASFLITRKLVDGENKLELRATDVAGNVTVTPAIAYTRDATPPEVRLAGPAAAATMLDDTTAAPTVWGNTAWNHGTVAYNGGRTIEVRPGISYSKYAPHYRADSKGLPEWRVLVTDTFTESADIKVEFRVVRDEALVVNWTDAQPAPGQSFTHATTIHAGLAQSIGEVSGKYVLEIRATDRFGNTSEPTEANWTQTILPPVIKVEPARSSGFTQYNLQGDNFEQLLDQTTHERVAAVTVWNPNDVDVQAKLTSTIEMTVSAKLKGQGIFIGLLGDIKAGCRKDPQRDQNLAGTACRPYRFPGYHNGVPQRGQPYRPKIDHYVVVVNGREVACNDCEGGVVKLPAESVATVYATIRGLPLGFKEFRYGEVEKVGNKEDITAAMSEYYRGCARKGPGKTCKKQGRYREVQWFTQALVTFNKARMTIETRMTDGAEFSGRQQVTPKTDNLITAEGSEPLMKTHKEFKDAVKPWVPFY